MILIRVRSADLVRFLAAALIAVLGSVAAPASAADSDFERQVLAALNAARANPASMAADLRAYRSLFRGTIVSPPGGRPRRATREGVAPVDEAIAFLDGQSALPTLAAAPNLADAAASHVTDQGERGLTGHAGSDGSSAMRRIRDHGGRRYVAEVIQYGADDALDVVRNLIVDDGVADRGHRRILFDPALRLAGIGCGRHRDFGTMCVIDFAAASIEFASAETHPAAGMPFQTAR